MVEKIEIYSMMPDDDLTERQRNLKYMYWDLKKEYDRLINERTYINNRIDNIKKKLDKLD